jgi:ABC-type antimicrobial peptide transport system permease subunit
MIGFIIHTFRHLVRHFTVSAMNIAGLAAGLACTLMIYLWLTDELNYDRFHQNADLIFRVEQDQLYSNGRYHVNVTPWPSGPVWKEKIPEIQQQCRIVNAGTFLVARNEISFYEDKVAAVDSTFFPMFSFPLVSGNPWEVLQNPGSIVISVDLAEKYFGKEDPVGKTLSLNNNELFQVTGVFRMPTNSSIDYDLLIPFDYMKKSQYYSDRWDNNSIETYVSLSPRHDKSNVDKLLTSIVNENKPQNTSEFFLFPLTRIHLYSYWGYGHKPGAILSVWIFSAIAILVLVIGCINFMNLSTAQSSVRAKEIGLRKVNGADRRSLLIRFFGESLIISLAALIIAFVSVALLLPFFNQISGKEFHVSMLFTPVFLGGALTLVIVTGIFAGVYPALVMSSFKPAFTLKQGSSRGKTGTMFRRISVVVQFSLSIILIAGTLIIYRQLGYIHTQSLGYDKENLLYISLRGGLRDAYPMLKEELRHEPYVAFISASTDPPHSIGSNSDNAHWEGKPADMDVLVSMSGVDFDYVETMGIKMKSGRSFNSSFPGDQSHDTLANFLINEEMEKVMGMPDAAGAALKFGSSGTVVGVMEDYNFQSLHTKIEPLAISMWGNKFLNFMYIRLRPGDLPGTMKQLGETWKRIAPAYPFDYHFVDQELDKSYKTEERTGKLMNYFSALALIIGCIGLFGLSIFTLERKTREVGIRKAHGAKPAGIYLLFIREFFSLLVVASCIAIPVSWYIFSRYLANYTYRIQINALVFVESVAMTLLIALLAVSYQAWKATGTDPAITLKHE